MTDEVSTRLGKKPISQFLADDRKFISKIDLVLALVARSNLEENEEHRKIVSKFYPVSSKCALIGGSSKWVHRGQCKHHGLRQTETK